MSIKIDNLENNKLPELAIADSMAIFGGTHQATLPRIFFPTLPGSASTTSVTAISSNSVITSQSAFAFGPGFSFANASAEASIDANGVRAKGGAVALNTASPIKH